MSIIRTIEEKDILGIQLLDEKKELAEIEWMYADPENPGHYQGFVLTDESDAVNGVIGFSKTSYTIGGHSHCGVMPLGWRVSEKHRGINGIRLFMKVLSSGEFSFTIGGTKIGIQTQALAKMQKLDTGRYYYKVLKPKSILFEESDKGILSRLYNYSKWLYKSQLSRIERKGVQESSVFFTEFKEENYMQGKLNPGFIYNNLTLSYIKWVLACPLVKTAIYETHYQGEFVGYCIVNFLTINGLKRGRIAYLPPSREFEFLKDVIVFCEQKLFEKGCVSVSTVSMNKAYGDALKSSTFKEGKTTIPIQVKGFKNGSINTDSLQWHLQMIEADKFVRIE